MRSSKYDLAQLRSLQDWYLRYQIGSVEGVAEVASVGGFVRQYQVNLDPNKLAAYRLPVKSVVDAIRMSNNDVGGRSVELSGAEYMVRGRGYIRSIKDIEMIAVGGDRGTPILVRDIASGDSGAGYAARHRRAERQRRSGRRHRGDALRRERAQLNRARQAKNQRDRAVSAARR